MRPDGENRFLRLWQACARRADPLVSASRHGGTVETTPHLGAARRASRPLSAREPESGTDAEVDSARVFEPGGLTYVARSADPSAMPFTSSQWFSFRRAQPRVAREYEVHVAADGGGGGAVYLGESTNISMGGVFIAGHGPPAVGDIVRVCVHDGEGRQVFVAGEVRWHRRDGNGLVDGAGVRFVAVDEGTHRELERLVAEPCRTNLPATSDEQSLRAGTSP